MEEAFKTSKVARGSVFLGAQNIIEFVVAFGFYFVAARLLTSAEVGQVSLLAFAMTIFTTLTQFSLTTAVTRYVSEAVGRQEQSVAAGVFKTGLKLLLLISVPSLAAALALSPFLSQYAFGGLHLNTLILVFATSFILDVAVFYASGMLGLGMYEKMILQTLSYIVVSRTLGLVLAFIGLGALGVVLGWMIGATISLFISISLLGRRLSDGAAFPSKRLIVYSLPVLSYTLILMVQNWADLLVLYAVRANLSEIGVYYLVVNGSRVPSVIWVAMCTALFPALSAHYGNSGLQGVYHPIFRSARLLNLLVIPIGVTFASISHTGLELAYGSAYRSGAVAFAILTVTLILPAYALLIVTIFQSTGKTSPLIVIGTVSVIVELVAVALLVPILGATGGAIARTLMYISIVGVGYYLLREKIRIPFTAGILKSIVFSLAIATPLAIVEFYTTWINPQTLLIRVAADFAAFLIMVIIGCRTLRVLEEEDFGLLREMLPPSFHVIVNTAQKILTKSSP